MAQNSMGEKRIIEGNQIRADCLIDKSVVEICFKRVSNPKPLFGYVINASSRCYVSAIALEEDLMEYIAQSLLICKQIAMLQGIFKPIIPHVLM